MSATGVNFPQAIAISPDGKNVYVAGVDANDHGTIAELARSADGSLTQLASPNDCIGENSGQTGGTVSACGTTGHGIANPSAVTVSADGANVYVADGTGNAVAEFARNANGALSQLGSPNNCIAEGNGPGGSADCGITGAKGLMGVDSLALSAGGQNLYVGGEDTIAEFARNANGSLTELTGANNCIQEQADDSNECGTETGVGIRSIVSLDVSPDGRNLYSSEGNYTGAVAEFARNANGS